MIDTTIDTRHHDWHYWPVVWSAAIIVFSIPQVLVAQEAEIHSHANMAVQLSLVKKAFEAIALLTCPFFVKNFTDIRQIACLSTLMCVPLEFSWYYGHSHMSFGVSLVLLALSTWGTVLYTVLGTVQVLRLNTRGKDHGEIYGTWMIIHTACTFCILCYEADIQIYHSKYLKQMRFWCLCATIVGAFLWYLVFDALTTRDNDQGMHPRRTIEQQLNRTYVILPILTLYAFFVYSMTNWQDDLQLHGYGREFNILRFFFGVGALIVFGWGYDYPFGKAYLMKYWVVKSTFVVAAMFFFSNQKYSVWHFFLTLAANFCADGAFVFTLATVASIAHKCETNTFTAFWFWSTLAGTILIVSVAAHVEAFVMVLALAFSAYVVFNNMLPTDQEEYAKIEDVHNSQLMPQQVQSRNSPVHGRYNAQVRSSQLMGEHSF